MENLFLATIVWTVIIGGLSLKFRYRIAGFFKNIPMPVWALYFLSGILYSWAEEQINCPPTGCSLFPVTVVFFTIFLIILFFVIKIFKVREFKKALIIFGLIGWIVEFLLGYHKEILWSNPFITIVMSFWVVITYSVIVIIPLTILLGNEKNKISQNN